MSKTLSLTLIVRNEEVHIPRVLEHAHIYADEIVIVDTGSEDNTKQAARRFTENIFDFEWCDDFAKARNYGIDRCSGDFIMWLDADDVVSEEDAHRIKDLIATDPQWDVGWCNYHISQDELGNTTYLTKRERIFRNNKGIQFVYPVHEVLKLTPDLVNDVGLDFINVYHRNIHRWQSSTDRNLRILEQHSEDEAYSDDYRFWMTFANECSTIGDYSRAVEYYSKALSIAPSFCSDHQNMMELSLGHAYYAMGDADLSLAAYERAIAVYAGRREPYFEAGKIKIESGDYAGALALFEQCESLPKPKDAILDGTLYEGDKVSEYIAIVQGKLGMDPSPPHEGLSMAAEMANPMMNEEKLVNIYHLFDSVLRQGLQGSVVELGCYEGVTSVMLQRILNLHGSRKSIHVYDSFEGLPSKQDDDGDTPYQEGSCATSQDRLIANFEKYGVRLPSIHVGWFCETLPHDLPRKICFAHLDGDFYSSILESLEAVYDRLVPGAVVVIDDYCNPQILNRWNLLPGVKKACDEFFQDKPENVEPMPCGSFAHGYFVKQ